VRHKALISMMWGAWSDCSWGRRRTADPSRTRWCSQPFWRYTCRH